jgi:hypothetical protein
MWTICTLGLQVAVEQKMKDPEFVQVFGDIRDRMNDGYYAPSYIELVLSKTDRYRRYDLVDAYVFGSFTADLWGGYPMTAEIGFSGEVSGPRGDKCGAENNRLLSQLVPPFRGTFRGQSHGGDGFIQWVEPIRVERRLGDDEREVIEVAPQSLLLEAGNLHLFNGWHHTRVRQGGFARWSCGSPVITLIMWHRSNTERRFAELE